MGCMSTTGKGCKLIEIVSTVYYLKVLETKENELKEEYADEQKPIPKPEHW